MFVQNGCVFIWSDHMWFLFSLLFFTCDHYGEKIIIIIRSLFNGKYLGDRFTIIIHWYKYDQVTFQQTNKKTTSSSTLFELLKEISFFLYVISLLSYLNFHFSIVIKVKLNFELMIIKKSECIPSTYKGHLYWMMMMMIIIMGDNTKDIRQNVGVFPVYG